MPLLKNVAGQFLSAFAFDKTTGVAKTGDAANITALLAIDNGAPAATNDVNPSELGTTGIYVFTATQAETNGDKLDLAAVSATANVLLNPITIYPFDPIASIDDLLNKALAAFTTAGTVGDNLRQVFTKAITFPDVAGSLPNASGQDANFYAAFVDRIGAANDIYTIIILRNGIRVPAVEVFAPGGGAGTPTLFVKREDSDGSTLVNSITTVRSGPGSTGNAFYHIETVNTLPAATAASAIITANIDGADRSIPAPVR